MRLHPKVETEARGWAVAMTGEFRAEERGSHRPLRCAPQRARDHEQELFRGPTRGDLVSDRRQPDARSPHQPVGRPFRPRRAARAGTSVDQGEDRSGREESAPTPPVDRPARAASPDGWPAGSAVWWSGLIGCRSSGPMFGRTAPSFRRSHRLCERSSRDPGCRLGQIGRARLPFARKAALTEHETVGL